MENYQLHGIISGMCFTKKVDTGAVPVRPGYGIRKRSRSWDGAMRGKLQTGSTRPQLHVQPLLDEAASKTAASNASDSFVFIREKGPFPTSRISVPVQFQQGGPPAFERETCPWKRPSGTGAPFRRQFGGSLGTFILFFTVTQQILRYDFIF